MRKFIKIERALLLVCVLAFMSLAGMACSKSAPVDVTLLPEAFRPSVYANQEYDVMDVLDEYDASYKFELTELFYLDGTLTRHDIEHNGTRFVQKEPYDVYVTLKVSNGKTSKEYEFILDTEILSSAQDQKWITTWSDTGVGRVISVDEGCVAEGSMSALKVTYLGANNGNASDGVNIGGIGYNDGTRTAWDNVVFTTKVYNPNDFDMQVAIMIIKNNGPYKNLGRFHEPYDLKAGEWTDVVWSFRSYGLDFDLEADGITYALKAHITDATAAGFAPGSYSWKLYFSGTDITDYTAEKFPDLETRTPDEIILSGPGDAVDKYLKSHVYEKSKDLNTYAETTVSGSVVTYEDNPSLAKLDASLSESTSYVCYDVTPTVKVDSGNYYFCPVDYSSSTHPITDGEAALHDLTYPDNVFVEFYVYNDTDETLTLIGTKSNRNYWDGKTFAVPSKEWTKITISLVDDYGIESDFSVANFKIFGRYALGSQTESETWQTFEGKVYIDGFKIYSEQPPVVETNFLCDYAVKGNYAPATYGYFYTTLKAEKSDDPKYNETDTVKYTVLNDGHDAQRRWFVPMAFGSEKTFASLLTALGKDISEINANSCIKFYVKNTSEKYDLQFMLTSGEEGTGNVNLINQIDKDTTTTKVTVPKNSEWTEVLLPLSNVWTHLQSADQTVSLCAGFLSTTNPFDSDVYYMGGFEICDDETPSEDTRGDEIDRYLGTHVYENTSALSQYGKTTVSGSVVMYEDNPSLAKPGDALLSDSTSYVCFDVMPTDKVDSGNYYFCLMDYSSTHPITDAEKALHDFSNPNKVFIEFWIYNDTDATLNLLSSKKDGSNRNYWGGSNLGVITGKTWTKVTISLVDAYGIESDFTTANFKIFGQYALGSQATESTWESFEGKVYIDGFKIYSEA